ncbi:MAG: DUF4331 family protein [Myxococcales bacterium]|nr:DUF4331 family protein [Myxococcales bacterium]
MRNALHLTLAVCAAVAMAACGSSTTVTPQPDGGTPQPDGGSVAGFDFRTDAPGAYTRFDRVGMPAVSTVLAMDKDAYNDGTPTADANLDFAGQLITSLTNLHAALDDDFTGAGLTPCSMDPSDPNDAMSLPKCLAQEVAPGVSVVSLVVPDTLTLDTSKASGFPNGRLLTDPVIDVTLNVIFLDLSVHGPGTLAGVPINPPANDVAFLSAFPYLAPPHTL